MSPERATVDLLTGADGAVGLWRNQCVRRGEKTVQSQMVLTFLFKPESNEF